MDDFIMTYSREEAIADGTLVDVTRWAREAGIKFPVAITEALQNMIEDKPSMEDVEGRTWDVLWMLKCAIKGAIASEKKGDDLILYRLVLNDSRANFDDDYEAREVTLKALIHGGDNGEPVITIMLPDED